MEAVMFHDKITASAIRVEFIDDDGGCEVAIFDGPRAKIRLFGFSC